MNLKSLNLAIEDVRKRLDGRNKEKRIAQFIITALIAAPVFYFIEPGHDGRFPPGTLALIVSWLGFSAVTAFFIANILFRVRTEELSLLVEIGETLKVMNGGEPYVAETENEATEDESETTDSGYGGDA